jgi:hypothetical protein
MIIAIRPNRVVTRWGDEMIKGRINIQILVLNVSIGLVLAQSAFSYSVISDPDLFYAFFIKPKLIIEFNQLKDGTGFGDTPHELKSNNLFAGNQDCPAMSSGETGLAAHETQLAIRPYAFSNAWHFMGVDPNNSESFCNSVLWVDDGISTGSHQMAVIAAYGQSQPFVLHTNKGFMGILPDNRQETIFIFDDVSRVFSFETDFLKDVSVSDSDDTFLARVSDLHKSHKTD